MRAFVFLVAMITACAPVEDLGVQESAWTRGSVYRARFGFWGGYVMIEVLDDDLSMSRWLRAADQTSRTRSIAHRW